MIIRLRLNDKSSLTYPIPPTSRDSGTLGLITDMHARVDEATAAVSKSTPTPAATSPISKFALSKPATNKVSPQIKLQMFSGNSLE